MLSIPHLVIIFVIALVVFGPQKLPELARSLGKLMAEFRKASGDFKSAFEEEMRDLERQAALAERRKQAEAAAASAAAAQASLPAEASSADAGQPATLATPAGSETTPVSSESQSDRRATEAPVITPVAESIARSSEPVEEAANTEHAAATAPQDTSHDAQHLA
jgi:TatA/E family protein of Tat protein translocase